MSSRSRSSSLLSSALGALIITLTRLAPQLVEAGLVASIGTLYPLLGRLRTQGLVTAFGQPSATGPVRKYYRLTPLERAQLAAFRLQWGPFTASVHQFIGEDTHD